VTALGLFILIPYGVWNLDAAHLMGAFRSGAPVLPLEILYLILMGTVVAYVSWYRGIQGASPARIVLYHYLVSVISMIVGFALLKEIPSAGQILGAGLVLGGLIITKVLPQPRGEIVLTKS
jgi:drug/metabolite transporter (DMT)-like permease